MVALKLFKMRIAEGITFQPILEKYIRRKTKMEEEVFNKDLGEIIRIGIFLPVPFRFPIVKIVNHMVF